MSRFSLHDFLNDSYRPVSKNKKPTHVIVIISASNQIVTSPNDTNYRLDSDESKKLIKGIRLSTRWGAIGLDPIDNI